MSKVKKGMMIAKSVVQQPSLIGHGIKYIKQNGIRKLYTSLAAFNGNRIMITPENEKRIKYTGHIKFSILMPVYNVDVKWLEIAIESIKSQNYRNWELCIVDDCSTDEKVREYLSKIQHKKIKIYFAKENSGISAATNKCAEIASGDFYLLMDNDDEIASFALDEFYKCFVKTGADIIYSDQDIVDMNGNHMNPLHKPDWSPDLFLSQMYIGHLVGFKKKLFKEAGGFRTEYNGSQDYDLLLRMVLKTDKIYHIPKILYSWRDIPSSTAANPESKPYAQTAGLNAVQYFLDTRYGKGAAIAHETDSMFVYDVRYALDEKNKVGIIIPTKDHVDLLKTAIDSILSKTEYSNYEIIILNNNSVEMETYDYFEKVEKEYSQIKVHDALFEFNWSKLNNYGISLCDADVYVFLNNDVKIIDGQWLTRLAEKALRDEIGVVGGLLLYEDDTIQHAGVVVGMGGWAEHVFKGMAPVHYGTPYISPMVTRNVTAVTGACLAVSQKTLEEIGRFDERFIICGSDIELGIRAVQRGFYNVYDPNVKLYHYESKSRDSYVPEVDFEMSYKIYTPFRESGDPFYNSNLDYYVYQPQLKKTSAGADCNADMEAGGTRITAQEVKVDEINPYYFRKGESERKRLNLLVPSINPEHVFGGISTAIKFYQKLAQTLDYDQRIILVDAVPSKEALAQYSDYEVVAPKQDSNASKQIVSYAYRDECGIPVAPTDYFMFTGWWTAHCTQEAYDAFEKEYGIQPNPYLYFIQDYEPGFYAWSTRYMLADATYKTNNKMIAVFNSLLLKEYFDKNGYHFEHAFAFEPVLNASLKSILQGKGGSVQKKKQILIYGRPSTDRNAFSLIVAALNKWVKNYDACMEWEIYSAGELHPEVVLENGMVIHSVGKLLIEEYAEVLSESFAGISLMVSPHPSYPPLEMATFGVKVITNTFSNKDLKDFSPNIISLDTVNPVTISNRLSNICSSYCESVSLANRNDDYIDNDDVFSFVNDIKNILDK